MQGDVGHTLDRVVDEIKTNQKKWRAEEEERHKHRNLRTRRIKIKIRRFSL
jgi:thiamine pyrophosphate-dependent acetolactate synthase large subunit-like protein